MKLLVKSRLPEEDFTVGSVIKMGNHMGNNFQLYGIHPFSPVCLKKYNKGVTGIQWLQVAWNVKPYLIDYGLYRAA